VVTPLTFSLLSEEMTEHMVRRRLQQAGLHEMSRRPVFQLVRGYVYVNASLMTEVMGEVPSLVLSDGVLALLPEDLRPALAQRHRAVLDPRTVATVLRLTWNEVDWAPWSRAALFRKEADRVARELAGFQVSPSASGADLAVEMEAIRGRLGRFLDVVSWGMIYAYVFFHLLAHLQRQWLPDEHESVAALLAGIPGIRTFEVHEELFLLAARLRDDPGLRAEIVDSPASEAAERAARGDLGDFGRDLLRLVERHGHRLVARDLSFPTWRERPSVLVEMVRRLAVSGSGAASSRREHREERLRSIEAELSRGLAGPVRLQAFRAVLRLCEQYYAVRENMRYHADYFLSALRALALAAGDRLVAAGALADREDVFYLQMNELEPALRGNGAVDVGVTATRRRCEYQTYRNVAPPEVLWSEGAAPDGLEPAEASRAPADAPVLHGVAAAPGSTDGSVRVVRSVEELEGVLPGEVIVATATDPTWTSFLALASGLVLEVGGLLSHGAIIARELGIPAVVDVSGATTVLTTGERVRIDGGTGVVQRLDGRAAAAPGRSESRA
jgi:phosphohistidine swiveling domain-containing protein